MAFVTGMYNLVCKLWPFNYCWIL